MQIECLSCKYWLPSASATTSFDYVPILNYLAQGLWVRRNRGELDIRLLLVFFLGLSPYEACPSINSKILHSSFPHIFYQAFQVCWAQEIWILQILDFHQICLTGWQEAFPKHSEYRKADQFLTLQETEDHHQLFLQRCSQWPICRLPCRRHCSEEVLGLYTILLLRNQLSPHFTIFDWVILQIQSRKAWDHHS